MKIIPLTRNKYTLVDDEDYDRLARYKWHCTYYGYAASRIDNKIVWMHRLIMNTPVGMHTDHIDGDKLNNQRQNLRVCTSSQNKMNRSAQRNNTSGFKGVSWHKQRGKWTARIKVNGSYRSLGLHDTPELAYSAYNQAALEHFGEFAWLNPELDSAKS